MLRISRPTYSDMYDNLSVYRERDDETANVLCRSWI